MYVSQWNKVLFSTPPKKSAHVVTKHRSDLHLSSNLQVLSNVILPRVGAILLVRCTLQTRALVHTPRRNSAKKDFPFGAEVEKNFHMKKIIEFTFFVVTFAFADTYLKKSNQFLAHNLEY